MRELKREMKCHAVQVLLVLSIAAVALVGLERLNDWLFVHGPYLLAGFFGSLGPMAPVIFVCVYILANLFLVPSVPFIFFAGLVFGPIVGFAVSLASEVVSATINFFIGRKIKKKYLVHRVHDRRIRSYKRYIENHGFWVVLSMRYLGLYFDVLSYAAGMTKMRFRPYIAATFFGFLPYIFIYVYAGSTLMDTRSSVFILNLLSFKVACYGFFVVSYLAFGWVRSHYLEKSSQ